MGVRLKRGDLVEVMVGKDGPRAGSEKVTVELPDGRKVERRRGKRGKVLRVLREEGRVLVEGVNVVRAHRSPRKYRHAGIVEKEAPIDASNVMLVDPKLDVPTRVRFGRDEQGRKVRIAVASGTVID